MKSLNEIVDDLTKDWYISIVCDKPVIFTGADLKSTRLSILQALWGIEFLRNFSETELKVELERRAEARRQEEESKKVTVICPLCRGLGDNLVDAYNCQIICSLCKGEKKIKAIKCQ